MYMLEISTEKNPTRVYGTMHMRLRGNNIQMDVLRKVGRCITRTSYELTGQTAVSFQPKRSFFCTKIDLKPPMLHIPEICGRLSTKRNHSIIIAELCN